MVPALVLGVAILVGFLMLGRWYVQAAPGQIIRLARVLAIILGVGFLLFILLGQRWSWLPGILFVGLPWLNRLRALRSFARNMRGPSPGQTSTVNTAYFRMTLDHDSGAMDGQVLAGTFSGRELSTMTLDEHLGLMRECAGDEQSAAVLAAYLDRVFPQWRDHAGAAGDQAGAGAGAGAGGRAAPGGGAMTRDEALEILGLDATADDRDIETAYRALMQKMHPDVGGSDYFAAKLNEAKAVLLGN